MFIELVETLRCTRDHDESWLVASISLMRGRSIVEGTLGCPGCGAEYPVRAGVADFSAGVVPNGVAAPNSNDEDIALRAGGYLALSESPDSLVVLGGAWARGADILTRMSGARIIAVNAPPMVRESESVGLVLSSEALPLAKGSAFGVALDDSFSAAAVDSAILRLRPGARLVAPGAVAAPESLKIVARNESYWIAENPAEVIPLRRASR